jgi:hypothetical protein
VPRYDLPPATDGAAQWIELKDRAEITRKEIHRIRLAFDAAGDVEKTEAQTISILANCLTNWDIHTSTGEQLPRPQSGNVKQMEEFADRIPWDTWSELEDVINGTFDDTTKTMVGGYSQEHLKPSQKDPQTPSNG